MAKFLRDGDLPTYVEPSKGGAVLSNKHEGAHVLLDKGDPKVNGPYLDDIRAAEEVSYRKARLNATKKPAKKTASSKKKAQSKKKASAPVAKVAAKKTAAKKASKK